MKVYRPVKGDIRISSEYGGRIDPVTGDASAFHYGIDFACPEGTPIVACVTGPITKAGWQNEQDHKEGFGYRVWQQQEGTENFVVYGHLSKIHVAAGEAIVAGTRIGLSGVTGKSSGPHLHLEGRVGGISGHKGVPLEFL